MNVIRGLALVIFFTNVAAKKPDFWDGLDRRTVESKMVQGLRISPDKIRSSVSFWQRKYGHASGWIPYYEVVADVIRSHSCRIGCEVGVAFATQSAYILAHTDVELLYSIDPYVLYGDDPFPRGASKQLMDVLAFIVRMRLARFGARSQFIRKKSVDASLQFADNSLDFVYIDGDHSYTSVTNDLNAWYSKIRVGGLIIGDDYRHERFPGLTRAVDEFVQLHNVRLEVRPGRKYFFVKV